MKKLTSKKALSLQVLLPLALSLFLTGCSSFSREWRTTLKQPQAADSIAGAWEGRWVSDLSGHEGKLWCIMTRKTESEYDARFKARYKKIFSFSYTVPMQVKRSGNSWKFEGEADLGKIAGGVYNYTGAASTTNFFSTYDNKYDHGKFEMARPK